MPCARVQHAALTAMQILTLLLAPDLNKTATVRARQPLLAYT
jgi:hypothetical protein